MEPRSARETPQRRHSGARTTRTAVSSATYSSEALPSSARPVGVRNMACAATPSRGTTRLPLPASVRTAPLLAFTARMRALSVSARGGRA